MCHPGCQLGRLARRGTRARPAKDDPPQGRVTAFLQTALDRGQEEVLERGVHFPVGWDPYFKDFMSLRDVYHYPAQHYDHHRTQLTL